MQNICTQKHNDQLIKKVKQFVKREHLKKIDENIHRQEYQLNIYDLKIDVEEKNAIK